MPNGKQAKVHHIGNIQLTPSLTLCNALRVPNFHYNLPSASRLAKQLTTHVVFNPHHLLHLGPFNEKAYGHW